MVYHHVYKFWLLGLLEKNGSFKEAATEARITQSALSQNLSSLEAVTQKSLVIRERGSVRLTEDGISLMRRVKPILEALEFVDLDQSENTEIEGSIRLGAYESIAVEYMPQLFKKIEAIYPKVKIDVQTSRTENLVKQVRKGSLDMALVINGQSDNKLIEQTLFVDQLGIYISGSVARAGASLEDYQAMGLATISPSTDGHPLFYKNFLKTLPASLKTVFTCDSFETIRSFASNGIMLGLLPSRVAGRTPGLVRVWPIDDEFKGRSSHRISLLSRKNVSPHLVELIHQEMMLLQSQRVSIEK